MAFERARIVEYDYLKDAGGAVVGIEVVGEITDTDFPGATYRGAVRIEGDAYATVPAGPPAARIAAVKALLAPEVKERHAHWRASLLAQQTPVPRPEAEVAALPEILPADLPADEPEPTP